MVEYAVSIKYMIIGYSASFLMLAIYLVSLALRWKRLKRDLDMLENLEENNNT
jgi:hypothetical protein